MPFLSQRVKKAGINLPPSSSLAYALMGFLNQRLLASLGLPHTHHTKLILQDGSRLKQQLHKQSSKWRHSS